MFLGFENYGLYLLFSLPALLLGFWAQMKVRGAFEKFSQVRTATGRVMSANAATAANNATPSHASVLPNAPAMKKPTMKITGPTQLPICTVGTIMLRKARNAYPC